MAHFLFPAGSLTPTGSAQTIRVYRSNTALNPELDLFDVDGLGDLGTGIPDGIIVTDTAGNYPAFFGPEGLASLWLAAQGIRTHVLSQQGVSADTGNALTLGSDGLPYLSVDSIPTGGGVTTYVRFTTVGSTFDPTVDLVGGSTGTVTWTVEGSSTTATGLSPALDFGTTATRHVRMSVADGDVDKLADVVTLNLGFNHLDDAGTYNMGAGYDKAAEAVSGVENLTLLTGLIRFAAANISTLVGTLNFTDLSALEYIECAYSQVTGITLTGCTSLKRLCLEQNNLSEVDLNPVAANLLDFRGAFQAGGTLTLTTLTSPLASLYHFCVRDQTVVNHPTSSQLPVLEERWTWNTGQTGAFVSASTALKDVRANGNSYTSADLTDQFPTGRDGWLDLSSNSLTSITLTGCSGLTTIDLSDNSLSSGTVDAILVAVNGFATSNGTLDLSTNNAPSSTGTSAVTALRGRGWTVTVDASGGGGGTNPLGTHSDDFERADATGLAAIGNGWSSPGTATANIVSGDLVRTDTGSYQVLVNAALSDLPANYSVVATVPHATLTTYFGLVGRWNGSEGVKAFFDGGNGTANIRIGGASAYTTGDVTITLPGGSSMPTSWSDTGIDHTMKLTMSGTSISFYCDETLIATATCSINSSATGTGYGICGAGENRHWRSVGVTIP